MLMVRKLKQTIKKYMTFGKRRKNMLPEPIETVIARAQQDFDVAGWLTIKKYMIFGKRRKNMLPEPIETVIARAQQDFDVAGRLNLIQIQISDDTVLNILKKYKNVTYKITPIGLLFPATVKNDTNFIFVTANNISGVKKGIMNYKTYNILAEINTNKISNWNEIKGQSVWVNFQFKDHKEINNNSHLCFPFITRSFSDLTSFNIFLQDDQNKKIEFKEGEKKISIFNFQIDVYLT